MRHFSAYIIKRSSLFIHLSIFLFPLLVTFHAFYSLFGHLIGLLDLFCSLFVHLLTNTTIIIFPFQSPFLFLFLMETDIIKKHRYLCCPVLYSSGSRHIPARPFTSLLIPFSVTYVFLLIIFHRSNTHKYYVSNTQHHYSVNIIKKSCFFPFQSPMVPFLVL